MQVCQSMYYEDRGLYSLSVWTAGLFDLLFITWSPLWQVHLCAWSCAHWSLCVPSTTECIPIYLVKYFFNATRSYLVIWLFPTPKNKIMPSPPLYHQHLGKSKWSLNVLWMNEPELWPRIKNHGEDNCTNKNCWLLLSTYCVLDIVLSTKMNYII